MSLEPLSQFKDFNSFSKIFENYPLNKSDIKAGKVFLGCKENCFNFEPKHWFWKKIIKIAKFFGSKKYDFEINSLYFSKQLQSLFKKISSSEDLETFAIRAIQFEKLLRDYTKKKFKESKAKEDFLASRTILQPGPRQTLYDLYSALRQVQKDQPALSIIQTLIATYFDTGLEGSVAKFSELLTVIESKPNPDEKISKKLKDAKECIITLIETYEGTRKGIDNKKLKETLQEQIKILEEIVAPLEPRKEEGFSADEISKALLGIESIIILQTSTPAQETSEQKPPQQPPKEEKRKQKIWQRPKAEDLSPIIEQNGTLLKDISSYQDVFSLDTFLKLITERNTGTSKKSLEELRELLENIHTILEIQKNSDDLTEKQFSLIVLTTIENISLKNKIGEISGFLKAVTRARDAILNSKKISFSFREKQLAQIEEKAKLVSEESRKAIRIKLESVNKLYLSLTHTPVLEDLGEAIAWFRDISWACNQKLLKIDQELSQAIEEAPTPQKVPPLPVRKKMAFVAPYDDELTFEELLEKILPPKIPPNEVIKKLRLNADIRALLDKVDASQYTLEIKNKVYNAIEILLALREAYVNGQFVSDWCLEKFSLIFQTHLLPTKEIMDSFCEKITLLPRNPCLQTDIFPIKRFIDTLEIIKALAKYLGPSKEPSLKDLFETIHELKWNILEYVFQFEEFSELGDWLRPLWQKMYSLELKPIPFHFIPPILQKYQIGRVEQIPESLKTNFANLIAYALGMIEFDDLNKQETIQQKALEALRELNSLSKTPLITIAAWLQNVIDEINKS